jgi:hypothetical protein
MREQVKFEFDPQPQFQNEICIHLAGEIPCIIDDMEKLLKQLKENQIIRQGRFYRSNSTVQVDRPRWEEHHI